ncbi:hypothetical protein EDF56_107166 [Novosphingobium sp. PhB165]|uniref:YybH family protein n=1 Tax=Novosphingobium sp. PhB165 TaxID=2485105 RepID=UPI00104D205A|nr:nuclear transport factor 2 family protein [Novosphingobium sp. PhB165]TCM16587.1 hypothetical protein EDF56_107166 [Novosphingobium sp. PhB165]
MNPSDVADRYFEVVRARDIEGLIALYADDATITLPNGKVIEGADAIRAFQTDVFNRGAPYPTPGSRVVGAQEVSVEIKAKLPDGSVRSTANFFYVNGDGRIQRLSVYAQGG